MTPTRGPGDPASAVPPRSVLLRDRRRVLVRPLTPGDRDALAAGYARLSGASQRARFGAARRVLGQAALDHLVDSVDGVDHVAFAAFAQDGSETMVAVARILRYVDDPDSLDVGLTVADDYQDSGLGRALTVLLAAHRPRPANRIITQISDDNDRAMSLLAAFGAPRSAGNGLVVVDFRDEPVI